MLLQKDRKKLLLQTLKNARLEAGMRQVDVALALSRPQSYIAKIESGERKIDLIEFLDFSNAVQLDPVKLIRRLIWLNNDESRAINSLIPSKGKLEIRLPPIFFYTHKTSKHF